MKWTCPTTQVCGRGDSQPHLSSSLLFPLDDTASLSCYYCYFQAINFHLVKKSVDFFSHKMIDFPFLSNFRISLFNSPTVIMDLINAYEMSSRCVIHIKMVRMTVLQLQFVLHRDISMSLQVISRMQFSEEIFFISFTYIEFVQNANKGNKSWVQGKMWLMWAFPRKVELTTSTSKLQFKKITIFKSLIDYRTPGLYVVH